MKRAVIFYNGNLSDLSLAKRYVKETDYIICADGGTDHALMLGLMPQTIIGDFDSLSKALQNSLVKHNIEFIRFQKEKDETDSELALQHAIENGYKKILIFGLFGTRLDHMLTNIFALSYLEKKGINVTFIEGQQEIQIIKNKIKIEGKIGDLVSLIPLGGNVKNVTTKGLQYKLTNEDLRFGYSRGISNVMTNKTAEVSVTNGLLLIIHTKDK